MDENEADDARSGPDDVPPGGFVSHDPESPESALYGSAGSTPEHAHEGARDRAPDAAADGALDGAPEGAASPRSPGDPLDAGSEAPEATDDEPLRTPGERFVARARPFLLPVALVVGVLVLIVRARGALEQSPRFVVDPSACAVVARPAWVSEPLARSLAYAVATGLGREASLLESRELQRWADVLGDPAGGISPWIESVERLEPRFPYQADLRIRLRKPVMTVDGVLIAASGHVLGPGPVAVTPTPLTYTGRHLDEDYRECAAAAGELVPFRAELESKGVRIVSVGIGGDGTVVFGTEEGAALSWGRSARKSEFSHLDLPPSERIGNLRQVLVDAPGLAGVKAVQLWTDRPVTTLRDG